MTTTAPRHVRKMPHAIPASSKLVSGVNKAFKQQAFLKPRWASRLPPREHSPCVLAGERPPPWALTFDIRERETEWTDENKARLVSLFAGQELGCGMEGVQRRMQDLVQVVPDLGRKVHTMKPGLLASLLQDTTLLAQRVARLKELLPHTNVSAMASKLPEILLQEADAVASQVQQLKQQLGTDNVDQLVEDYPSLLDAELVQEALVELMRLMPNSDPKRTLLRDPSVVLRVERGPKRLGPHPDS